MSISSRDIKRAIRKLLTGGDHRALVLELIDAEFFAEAIDFLQQVARAKLNQCELGTWYADDLLSEDLPKGQIANNAGLTLKSITNSFGSSRKDMVIDVSRAHAKNLLELIDFSREDAERLHLGLTCRVRLHEDSRQVPPGIGSPACAAGRASSRA